MPVSPHPRQHWLLSIDIFIFDAVKTQLENIQTKSAFAEEQMEAQKARRCEPAETYGRGARWNPRFSAVGAVAGGLYSSRHFQFQKYNDWMMESPEEQVKRNLGTD